MYHRLKTIKQISDARTKGILNLDRSVVNQKANRKPEVLTTYLSPVEHHQPISSYSQDIFLPRGGRERSGARGRQVPMPD